MVVKYVIYVYMPKKIPKKGSPEAHEDLKGFDIRINALGEIVSTYSVDKLNDFLDERVVDKKIDTRLSAEEE